MPGQFSPAQSASVFARPARLALTVRHELPTTLQVLQQYAWCSTSVMRTQLRKHIGCWFQKYFSPLWIPVPLVRLLDNLTILSVHVLTFNFNYLNLVSEKSCFYITSIWWKNSHEPSPLLWRKTKMKEVEIRVVANSQLIVLSAVGSRTQLHSCHINPDLTQLQIVFSFITRRRVHSHASSYMRLYLGTALHWAKCYHASV